MPRKLARSLQTLSTILLAVTLIFPNGITVAQSGGDGTPTNTPAPTETVFPADTAAPTETIAPTETVVAPVTPTPTSEPSTATPEATPTDTPASNSTAANDSRPHLSSNLKELADSYAAGGATTVSTLAQSMGISLQNSDQNVQVVAMLADGQTLHEARQIVAALGGLIEVDSDGFVQMSLPINNIYALADSPVFSGVRLPAFAEPMASPSEGVSQSGASDWQDLGITGGGVKVAVIDIGFAGYTSLLNNDLPPTALVHPKSFLSTGSMGVSTHGAQVAQTIFDMAPGIEMWLVTVSTDIEFADAMDWLITQNVDIINSSIGFLNYDDGDGNSATGGVNPLINSVNRVDSAGILFVIASGNQAVGHQEQTYADFLVTAVHSHNWASPTGTDIYNEIIGWPSSGACRQVTAKLTWNDWGHLELAQAPVGQDYDLHLMRFFGGVWSEIATSENDQEVGYPWPAEDLSFCAPSGGKIAIVVERKNNLGPSYLEVYANWRLEYQTPGSSLVSPADAPNAFTVGAFNWRDTSLMDSSQGPVNGAGGDPGGVAIKPDISGPTCTSTNLVDGQGGNGFCGTSAAAAHVAGAAALYLQVNPGLIPSQIRSDFESKLVIDPLIIDPGVPGKDNVWGAGTLFMEVIDLPGLAACVGAAGDCVPTVPWPLFQGNVARTGSSTTATVDANPALLWTSPLLTADVRSVVVGPGTLAYVKAGRYVYALNTQFGTIAWTIDLGALGAAKGPGAPALTLNENGTPLDLNDDTTKFVYVGSGDGYVYKLNGDTGAQVCKSAKLGADLSKASPVIGADGTAYFVDDTAAKDRLIAVNLDCSQKWAVNLGPGAGTSSPAYWHPNSIANDRIFVGADMLYSVTIWGGIDWPVALKTGAEAATVPTTPLVINDSVYAVNSLGDLYWVSDPTVPSSTLNFVRRVADVANGAHASGSLAAYFDSFPGINEYLLYWGNLNKFYRYDVTTDVLDAASLARTHALEIVGANLSDTTPVTTNPAVNQGMVFFGASNGKLYAVDAEDTSLVSGWPKTLGGSTAVGLAVATDANGAGSLFVPSTDDTLRLFGTLPTPCFTCNSESASDWPLFQQKVTRTGASAKTVPTPATPPLWTPLWSRAPGGDVFPPVAGKATGGAGQGITYFVSGGNLRALDLATRNVLWSYPLGVAGTPVGFAAPAVSANGVVYVGGRDGVLHAVDAVTGLRVWANDLGLDISKASPVIGDDGTVYVVEDGVANDRLIAVSHLGAGRWSASIGTGAPTSSPLYYDNGNPGSIAGDCVFVGGARLYGFAVGNIAAACTGWPIDGIALVTGTAPSAPLLVGTTLYVLNSLGDLYRVAVSGVGITLVGDAPVGAGAGSLAFDSGGCGGDGCIYWTLGGKLQRWDVDGLTPVATITGSTGLTTNSTPVIDAAGNVFFGTSDFKLWLFKRTDVNANLVYTAAGSMANAGAIINNPTAGAGDGILLWPSADDKLYAFGAVEGTCPVTCGLASSAWPALQSNNARVPLTTFDIGGANARQARLYTALAPIRPPVVDGSNIYFVAGQYLYARSKSADTPAWVPIGGIEKKYNLGLAVTAGAYGMPAIGTTDGANRIVYVGGADGNLHAVNAATGDMIWKTDVGNNISKASIAVGSGANGYIFVVEDNVAPAVDNLIAVDYKGSIVWKQAIGNSAGTSSPAINGPVVVVGGGAGLYAFNVAGGTTATGTWPATIGLTNGSVAFLTDYYVVTNAAQLYKVATDGTKTPLPDVAGTGGSAAPLVISGSPPRIYFGVGAILYRFQSSLSSLTLGGDLGSSSPLTGSSAAFIYIASSDGKMYIVPETFPFPQTPGSISYTSPAAGASMAGSGAFIDNDTLVWPAQTGKLLVFDNSGAASGGITIDGLWPFFQNNDTHTGAGGAAVDKDNAVEQVAILGAGDARAPVIDNGGRAYFTAGRFLNVVNSTGLITKFYDLGATSSVAGYASPAVVNSGGTKVIVADNNGLVRAYDPDSSGAGPLWSVDVGANTSKASPLIGRNGLVYVLEDAAVDRLHAISLATGGLLWTRSLGAGPGTSSPMYWDNGTPALTDDSVLVGADKLYKVDANIGTITGSTIALGAVASAPLQTPAASNQVYVLTTAAKIYTFNIGSMASAGSNLTIVGAVGSASLAASGSNIFFAVGNKLYRADVASLSLTPPAPVTLGTLATNFTNSTPLVDSGGKVFIGGADGFLYGVDGAMSALTPAYTAVDGKGWPKKIGLGTAAASAAGALAMDASGNLYAPSIDDNLRRFGLAPAACADCDLYTEAPWPMFQHDVVHTGHNDVGAGHRTPIVHWAMTTTTTLAPPRTPVLGPPTISFSKGVLYYTSGQFVYARDAANGNSVWATPFPLGLLGNPGGGASPALLVQSLGGNGCSDPTSCNNDTVRVIVGAKDGFLYALNANDGGLVWRVDLGLDISKSSPLIGPDGTIYIVEDAAIDRLHAVYWNGTRKWTRDLAAGTGASSPVFFDTATDAVIVGSANKMYSFNAANGTPTTGWPVTVGTVGTVNTTPAAIGDDLWVLNSTGKLYNINLLVPAPAATLVTTGVGAISDGVAPAIQSDPYHPGNDVIFFTAGTGFYRVQWTGNLATTSTSFWPFALVLGNTSPVIDDNGWSYVLDSGGYLRAFYRYAIRPFMVYSKKIATQGTLAGGVIVGNTGTLYVPSRNNKVYKVDAP